MPIPNGVLVLFAVALIAAFVLSKTALGRYTFALGSNEEAVRLSGVNVDRWKIAVYATAGGICGVAGILIASRLNSAQPALGQGYELDAIAAVVIGGTSLSGGRGTVLGTLIGALIISVLANGLRILSVPQEWQTVVTGTIIILRRLRRHPAAPHTLGAERSSVRRADANKRQANAHKTDKQPRWEETHVHQTHAPRRSRRGHHAVHCRRLRFAQDKLVHRPHLQGLPAPVLAGR